jgi:hypothetical protein
MELETGPDRGTIIRVTVGLGNWIARLRSQEGTS